jgi:hypothetical protein
MFLSSGRFLYAIGFRKPRMLTFLYDPGSQKTADAHFFKGEAQPPSHA